MQGLTANITGKWEAYTPVAFRIIRQGLRLNVFVDNTMPPQYSNEILQPIDIGPAATAAFHVSPGINHATFLGSGASLDACVSDMSLWT